MIMDMIIKNHIKKKEKKENTVIKDLINIIIMTLYQTLSQGIKTMKKNIVGTL
jgi:hypothetical protein